MLRLGYLLSADREERYRVAEFGMRVTRPLSGTKRTGLGPSARGLLPRPRKISRSQTRPR
jgi:hypothetical protein